MEEFERTIYQINKDIKPEWEDIKYLSEKLVINQIIQDHILEGC